MTRKITHRPLDIVGRKPKQPPGDAAEKIEALAAEGWSVLGIAKRLGTSAATLRRWLEEYPELQESIAQGRQNEHQALYSMLFKQAVEKNNVTAAAILLNARHGYRQDDRAQIANKVSVNVNAETLAELAKLLPN